MRVDHPLSIGGRRGRSEPAKGGRERSGASTLSGDVVEAPVWRSKEDIIADHAKITAAVTDAPSDADLGGEVARGVVTSLDDEDALASSGFGPNQRAAAGEADITEAQLTRERAGSDRAVPETVGFDLRHRVFTLLFEEFN
jgi:hypothetical protein